MAHLIDILDAAIFLLPVMIAAAYALRFTARLATQRPAR
jgi:hypothetical protein